ncbi:MAG: hypothetical protein NHB32_08500 [Fischerella sp. CENA71]|nr:hypothetical protein [Fischerella sp. CENA71]
MNHRVEQVQTTTKAIESWQLQPAISQLMRLNQMQTLEQLQSTLRTSA